MAQTGILTLFHLIDDIFFYSIDYVGTQLQSTFYTAVTHPTRRNAAHVPGSHAPEAGIPGHHDLRFHRIPRSHRFPRSIRSSNSLRPHRYPYPCGPMPSFAKRLQATRVHFVSLITYGLSYVGSSCVIMGGIARIVLESSPTSVPGF